MPNSDPEGHIFLFTPHTNVKILFRAYIIFQFLKSDFKHSICFDAWTS